MLLVSRLFLCLPLSVCQNLLSSGTDSCLPSTLPCSTALVNDSCLPSTLLCSSAPGNDSCPADSPAPGTDLRLPSTLLCSTAPVTTPARLTLPLLVSPLVRPWFSLVHQPAGCLRLPACLGASSLRWRILTGSSEPLTFSHFPQPLNKLLLRLRNWVSLPVCPVPVTLTSCCSYNVGNV